MARDKKALTNTGTTGNAARKDLQAGKDEEMIRKSLNHVKKGRIAKKKPSVKGGTKQSSKAGKSKSDEDPAHGNKSQGSGKHTATPHTLAEAPKEEVKIGTHVEEPGMEVWGPRHVDEARWNRILENKWTWVDTKLDKVVLDCYSKHLSAPEASLGQEEKRNIILEFWGIWNDLGKYKPCSVKIGTWRHDRRFTVYATMRKGNSGSKEGMLLCFPRMNGSYYNRPISMADVELNQAFNRGKLEDSIAHIKTFFKSKQDDEAGASTQGGLQVRSEEQLGQNDKYSRISHLEVGSISTQSSYSVVFATFTEDQPGNKTLVFLPEGEVDNSGSRIQNDNTIIFDYPYNSVIEGKNKIIFYHPYNTGTLEKIKSNITSCLEAMVAAQGSTRRPLPPPTVSPLTPPRRTTHAPLSIDVAAAARGSKNLEDTVTRYENIMSQHESARKRDTAEQEVVPRKQKVVNLNKKTREEDEDHVDE